MSQVTTFTVVGDSAASGVGDSLPNGTSFGWAYYLAKSFQDPLVFATLIDKTISTPLFNRAKFTKRWDDELFIGQSIGATGSNSGPIFNIRKFYSA